jgi:hypothetical protein
VRDRVRDYLSYQFSHEDDARPNDSAYAGPTDQASLVNKDLLEKAKQTYQSMRQNKYAGLKDKDFKR